MISKNIYGSTLLTLIVCIALIAPKVFGVEKTTTTPDDRYIVNYKIEQGYIITINVFDDKKNKYSANQ